MRKRVIRSMLALMIGLGASGCATWHPLGIGAPDDTPPTPRQRYAAALEQARVSLLGGQIETARAACDQASTSAEEGGFRDALSPLLRAEVLLRDGKPEAAAPLVDGLLAETPDSAQALEVRGKCRLASGRYAEAEADFARARAGYAGAEDLRRIADLRWYALGLQYYSMGRTKEAFESWGRVQDSGLRASLAAALEQEDAVSAWTDAAAKTDVVNK